MIMTQNRRFANADTDLDIDAGGFTFLDEVRHEVRGFRAWGTLAGRLLADHMQKLADQIEATRATTAEDFEARSGLLDQWSDDEGVCRACGQSFASGWEVVQ